MRITSLIRPHNELTELCICGTLYIIELGKICERGRGCPMYIYFNALFLGSQALQGELQRQKRPSLRKRWYVIMGLCFQFKTMKRSKKPPIKL